MCAGETLITWIGDSGTWTPDNEKWMHDNGKWMYNSGTWMRDNGRTIHIARSKKCSSGNAI